MDADGRKARVSTSGAKAALRTLSNRGVKAQRPRLAAAMARALRAPPHALSGKCGRTRNPPRARSGKTARSGASGPSAPIARRSNAVNARPARARIGRPGRTRSVRGDLRPSGAVARNGKP